MKTISFLTRYDRQAASVRQRALQYAPYLSRLDCRLELQPLFGNGALQERSNGGLSIRRVLRGYARRLRWVLSRPDSDLIWLHHDLFPFLPGIFESLVCRPGLPVVLDMDDAFFHAYDRHPSRIARFLIGGKYDSLFRRADFVFAGNEYIRSHVETRSVPSMVVPTVLETAHYRPAAEPLSRSGLSVGWLGSPSTWEEYMAPMVDEILPVLGPHCASLEVMGAASGVVGRGRLNAHAWSEAGELPFLQGLDIGVMPLVDTPWAQGKCGYKLIQYMACGVPVIASPVGVNAQIVEHGVNGFLASSASEWRHYMDLLLSDSAMRQRMGAAGRRKIECTYSLDVWGPVVARKLAELVGSPRSRA